MSCYFAHEGLFNALVYHVIENYDKIQELQKKSLRSYSPDGDYINGCNAAYNILITDDSNEIRDRLDLALLVALKKQHYDIVEWIIYENLVADRKEILSYLMLIAYNRKNYKLVDFCIENLKQKE